MKILNGNLVTLEPMCVEKHAMGYYEVSLDETIHRYTGNTVPAHIDDIEKLLKLYEKYFINWMIIANDTRDVIGIIRLGKPELENGIFIAGESQFLSSKYWRKGHMKEAKGLFYQYVFQELSVDVLYADVWEGNTNSMKSLESYGYKLVETRKEMFSKTGEYANKYIYTLTRNDYIRSLKNNA